jgi:hypothetical protein
MDPVWSLFDDFEQALDPEERHERGAHFTREADIARVIGPTIVKPWQERIAAIRTLEDAERVIAQMRAFHVLDPACGCGNFLYVALREMKRLEATLAAKWSSADGPYFTIHQLHGIELDGAAASLARAVLRMGEHLDQQIRHADALLVDWPRPEGELAIVGNPPYLGARKMRRELGDGYVDKLFARYPQNRAADHATYWFTRALAVLRPGERAGYVCTNSITQNESREASLDRILEKGGTITDAFRSYPWPGEAAVHVSIVNWVMAPYAGVKMLDGRAVSSISPALTEGAGVTTAHPIHQNEGLCFMGVTPGNSGFVLTDEQRDDVVSSHPASAEVIKPFMVGRDVNRGIEQRPARWIIDFGTMTRQEAELFHGAFRYAQRHVYGEKRALLDRKSASEKKRWWQFVRPRPELRATLKRRRDVLVIPSVGPHLIVSRQESAICFDHQLMVVALGDDYDFGILQSCLHEAWARARGSTLKGDLRYTNTTIFMTFPFPLHPDGRYDPSKRPCTVEAARTAAAAEAFDRLRSSVCRARGLGLTKVHGMLKAGELPELGRAYEALNDAVTACYGFPEGLWKDEGEMLRRLLEQNAAARRLPVPSLSV